MLVEKNESIDKYPARRNLLKAKNIPRSSLVKDEEAWLSGASSKVVAESRQRLTPDM